MDAGELKARIEGAKRRLHTAEEAMETALQEIGRAPRSEKSIISGALSAAFAEMKRARQDLTDLERVIAEEG